MATDYRGKSDKGRRRPFAEIGNRILDVRYGLIALGLALTVLAGSDAVSLAGAIAVFGLVSLGLLIRTRAVRDEFAVATEFSEVNDTLIEVARNVIELIDEPVFLLNAKTIIVQANRAAIASFPPGTRGTPFTFSLRNPTLSAAIDDVRRSGLAANVEFQQPLPAEALYRATITPIALGTESSTGDAHTYYGIVIKDLGAQRRMDAMRADFIANASHELRTPLTALSGYIETLQGPAANDAEARARFLKIMAGQAERMSRLIEDLLSLSRIERLQKVRPTDEIDLTAIISMAVEGLASRAKENDMAIVTDIGAGPALVIGQRSELVEVFENLIDNAIKYGADGDRIDIRLKREERGGEQVFSVEIADNGMGVSADHVPRLTERFYRVDAESSRNKKGTGLGLAIVKHIMSRHSGEMVLESATGEGMRVTLLFPVS